MFFNATVMIFIVCKKIIKIIFWFKLIERNKLRKRKPRASSKRSSYKNFHGPSSGTPKSRGNIARALEKYNNMAQDALSNGDRIAAESFHQYAEHYQRLLNEDKSHDNQSAGENLKNKNSSVSEMTDIKLSRTQRAINAKDERYKKIDSKNGSEKQEGFTSDGIEALKPFQTSAPLNL